ncbi:hypothetical protein ACYCAX_16300 [Pseudomonas sp. MT3]|uniref:hypothetical protein n=1 Tax=Pseudomonas sp. ATCC 13867 TaxID=1294143 RepID=UPI0002C4ED49|nr:hypothetical protein [Pseudomonas sp. ATCC 13867]AGI26163.1 hypothetical protein H681_21480 [Pseudomonas sp. ATCC 13867]RFQ24626.1 hypothetical protein D0N87_21875 [Pseudomonas sp. ATCC 13867]
MLKLSVVTFACITLVGCADAPRYNHFSAIESPVRESFGEDNLERQPTRIQLQNDDYSAQQQRMMWGQ